MKPGREVRTACGSGRLKRSGPGYAAARMKPVREDQPPATAGGSDPKNRPEFILQSGSRLKYRALSIRPKTCLAGRIVSLQKKVNTCSQKTAKGKTCLCPDFDAGS